MSEPLDRSRKDKSYSRVVVGNNFYTDNLDDMDEIA